MRLAEKYATGIPAVKKSLEDNGPPKLYLSTDKERSHFLAIVGINENTLIYVEDNYEEVEKILLSNNQQLILDKLLKSLLPKKKY